jgi:hypothetical protein
LIQHEVEEQDGEVEELVACSDRDDPDAAAARDANLQLAECAKSEADEALATEMK